MTRGPIALLPLLLAATCALAEDAPRLDARSYIRQPPPLERQIKSVRVEAEPAPVGAPVLNTRAPATAKSAQALALGNGRGTIGQMLQSREFIIGNPRSRSRELRDAGTYNGIDLDRVKLRISRDKVLVGAEFSFN
ncbi:MAG: hypothetical protein IPI73_14490 [Betaproteobacteria bacterium]|nr:hypothetical protein [Betaproteobacteria bacterium]